MHGRFLLAAAALTLFSAPQAAGRVTAGVTTTPHYTPPVSETSWTPMGEIEATTAEGRRQFGAGADAVPAAEIIGAADSECLLAGQITQRSVETTKSAAGLRVTLRSSPVSAAQWNVWMANDATGTLVGQGFRSTCTSMFDSYVRVWVTQRRLGHERRLTKRVVLVDWPKLATPPDGPLSLVRSERLTFALSRSLMRRGGLVLNIGEYSVPAYADAPDDARARIFRYPLGTGVRTYKAGRGFRLALQPSLRDVPRSADAYSKG